MGLAGKWLQSTFVHTAAARHLLMSQEGMCQMSPLALLLNTRPKM